MWDGMSNYLSRGNFVKYVSDMYSVKQKPKGILTGEDMSKMRKQHAEIMNGQYKQRFK